MAEFEKEVRKILKESVKRIGVTSNTVTPFLVSAIRLRDSD